MRISPRFHGVVALALTLALGPGRVDARISVAATTGSLGGIAEAVGGDLVTVTVLADPSEDPHFVDARPNLVMVLHSADLLVSVGLELEVGWLPGLERAARNPKIAAGQPGRFEAATALPKLLEVPTGRLDRAQGDVHPGGNPHFLYDPRRAAEVGHALAQRLAALDPKNAGQYVLAAQKFADDCRALGLREQQRFAALPPDRRVVVTYHASWVYLLDWLGLEVATTVEPKPGVSPSPAHVAQVLQIVRARGVRVILQEEYYPRGTSETLAKLTGAQLLLLEGTARSGPGQGYLAHVQRMTEQVHAALSR
jgi:zinc/manganese transport system substrate-binding protein